MSVCADCGHEHWPRPGLNCRVCGVWVPGFTRLPHERMCRACQRSVSNIAERAAGFLTPGRFEPAAERTREKQRTTHKRLAAAKRC